MKYVLAAVLIAALVVACRREAPPTSDSSAAPASATVAPVVDASTAEIDVRIPLIPNAVAKCETAKQTYSRDEPVQLTLDLNESPRGLRVMARLRRGEEIVARASEAADGRKNITLTIGGEVARGGYTLEGLWGGNIVCEHAVRVE